MTPKPTPRTDANVAALTKAPDCYCEAEFARQLERENQTFRAAQKACEDCDAPRVDRIDELERELEEWKDKLDGSELSHAATRADLQDCKRELAQERQDRKQADLDTIRALGERNDARAELATAREAARDRLDEIKQATGESFSSILEQLLTP